MKFKTPSFYFLLVLLILVVVLPRAFSFAVSPTTVTRINRQTKGLEALGDDSIQQAESPEIFLHHAPSVLSAHETSALSLTPIVGSSLIMLTIVGLLYLWEQSVEYLRESVPKTLLPMVESILGEIGGLGFIGLILQSVLSNNSIKEVLEEISIHFFGEGDIALENFEYLHSAFFQVGIGYFVAAGGMAALGIKKLEIKEVQSLQFDDQNAGICTASPDLVVQYIPECVNQGQLPGASIVRDDLRSPTVEKAARTVLMRYQVMKWFPHLPETFRVESYLQASFAYNLKKIVEVSPMTWVYLIPALAISNGIDLSHEVINAASPNAAESSGYFFSTFASIGPATFTVLVSAIWGSWNYWKLTQIKHMLLPRVGQSDDKDMTKILPPMYESKSEREAFDSSPAWIRPIEEIWAKPAKNNFEELFGAAGGVSLRLYQQSIKYQTWLSITHVVFFGTQIIPRDVSALVTGAAVGDPAHLTAELATYSAFVALALLQLCTVSTKAFWNLVLVAGAAEENRETLLEISGSPLPFTKEVVYTPKNATALEASVA